MPFGKDTPSKVDLEIRKDEKKFLKKAAIRAFENETIELTRKELLDFYNDVKKGDLNKKKNKIYKFIKPKK